MSDATKKIHLRQASKKLRQALLSIQRYNQLETDRILELSVADIEESIDKAQRDTQFIMTSLGMGAEE